MVKENLYIITYECSTPYGILYKITIIIDVGGQEDYQCSTPYGISWKL